MPEKEKWEPEEGKRRRGNEKPEPDMGHHCSGGWAAQSLGSKVRLTCSFSDLTDRSNTGSS